MQRADKTESKISRMRLRKNITSKEVYHIYSNNKSLLNISSLEKSRHSDATVRRTILNAFH
jgi:hypothetical protein